LNFELTVEFYDSKLADRLAGIIDKHRNRPITLEEIDKRAFIWKLRDAAARLAMPYI
jgi:cardiolipin synthase